MARAWLHPVAFSQIGQSHLRTKTPCQDSFDIGYSKDKEWVAITVSDGAGSAKYAQDGAKFVAQAFNRSLLAISEEIKTKGPGAWINDKILAAIMSIRAQLRDYCGRDDLSEYHATLVSVLMGPDRGIAVHIGDGSIYGGKIKPGPDGASKINDEFFISKPSNGEYANETFFITERNWFHNLRIQIIPDLDWLALGSDGGHSYAFRGNTEQLRETFLPVLFERLSVSPRANWEQDLNDIISAPAFEGVTDDDTTLIVLMRDKALAGNKFSVIQNNPADAPAHSRAPSPALVRPTPNQTQPTNRAVRPAAKAAVPPKRPERKILWTAVVGLIVLLSGMLVGLYMLYYPSTATTNPKLEAARPPAGLRGSAADGVSQNPNGARPSQPAANMPGKDVSTPPTGGPIGVADQHAGPKGAIGPGANDQTHGAQSSGSGTAPTGGADPRSAGQPPPGG